MHQSKLQFISGPIVYSHTGVCTPQGGGMSSVNTTGASSYGTVYQHVMVDNKCYPVMPSIAPQPAPTPYTTMYDPLEDIRSWYGVTNTFERQVDISINTILNNTVWERSEFDDWFDHNCRDKVYVQRSLGGGDQWRLFFVSRDDWYSFTTWQTRIRGTRWVVTVDKFTDEAPFNLDWRDRNKYQQLVENWLKEHATGKYKTMPRNHDIEVEFQNEQDAVMMKLVWLEGCPYIERNE